jgi:two-component system response regulator AtoC
VKHSTAGENPPEFQPVLRHALIAHDWPGNVRELENVLRRFLVYRNSTLIAEELREKTRHRMPQAQAAEPANVAETLSGTPPKPPVATVMSSSVPTASILGQVDQQRKKAEADAILAALDAALWNRKEAAAILDVDYKALLYKMKKLGIGEKKPARPAGEPAA